MPILLLSETSIDKRLRAIVHQFLNAHLVEKAEVHSFEAALVRIEGLHNRLHPEIIMLVIAYLPSLRPDFSDFYLGGVTTWHLIPSGGTTLSYAGWWFLLVSAPFYRFLILRWAWRIVLWGWFIRRVTNISLHLVPSHPDRAAGLGFLALGAKAFCPIVFACGAVVCGNIANNVLYEHGTLASTRALLITYVVGASLVLVAPLLLATPLLIRTRTRALLEFSALNAAHDQAFDARWIGTGSRPGEEILGSPDAISLATLSHGFEAVSDMRPIPLDRRTLIALAISAALPLIPVILITTPLDQLVQEVLKILR